MFSASRCAARRVCLCTALAICVSAADSEVDRQSVLATADDLARCAGVAWSDKEESRVCAMAAQFGAIVADRDGDRYSWEDAMDNKTVYKFPVTVFVTVPHLLVNNTSPHSVALQSSHGNCTTIAAGEERALPLVAMDGAVPTLAGAYRVRGNSTDCASACDECYWIRVDAAKPRGTFAATVGYGPAIPEGNLTQHRPQSYDGISGLRMTAHQDDDEVSINCTSGYEAKVQVLKPFHMAKVEILRASELRPEDGLLEIELDEARKVIREAELNSPAATALLFGLIIVAIGGVMMKNQRCRRHVPYWEKAMLTYNPEVEFFQLDDDGRSSFGGRY